MWNGQHKEWVNYRDGIIACDEATAMYLSLYVRILSHKKAYIPYLEVADIQRYRLYTNPKHVKAMLADSRDVPFVFVYNKN
jgi:hypothetical protein